MSLSVLNVGQTSKNQAPIVGIDLGTTNSLVAFVPTQPGPGGREPVVLTGKDGRRLVPSVVSFASERVVIGNEAKARKVRDAGNTVFSVKRLLGRSFEDLKALTHSLPFKLVTADSDTTSSGMERMVRVQVGEKAYSAIEISAMILRELRTMAEEALGMPVNRAVITVPAYFNDSQRQATRAAGRIAGWDVLRIINEPTAASLAYGLDRKKQGLIAVYDLGGGTFDISILRLHDGIFEVLATHGDTALGGDDLDQAIFAVIVRELNSRGEGLDLDSNLQLRASILEAAEKLKIELSTNTRAELVLPLNGYRREWTREEFEALALPILERTREPCLNALRDAGISTAELSDVVLVGGPTRLAVVQKMAREIFGKEPNTSVHPDEVVAAGAAIQADILAGNNRDLLLLDVVPLSLGIETYGGLMSTLIARNTRIPTVARENFTTFVDNQTGVDIHILQGERERVEDNRSLARFKLKGIRPAPAGTPRVEVTFLIDADGILQVAAKDLTTGMEQTIEVRPSYGLTDAEVEGMLLAGAENAEADIAYRRLVEVKNKAEPVLRAAEKTLPEARRLLPETEARAIEEKAGALRSALSGDDPKKIQEMSFLLNEETKKLADLLVKEAITGALDPH